jgi:hypothetical protein
MTNVTASVDMEVICCIVVPPVESATPKVRLSREGYANEPERLLKGSFKQRSSMERNCRKTAADQGCGCGGLLE